MTGRMIYQICTQRLTNEQIYMQRVTNECILRSKHEWGAGGVIDPAASQLVYQFNSKFSFETKKKIFKNQCSKKLIKKTYI